MVGSPLFPALSASTVNPPEGKLPWSSQADMPLSLNSKYWGFNVQMGTGHTPSSRRDFPFCLWHSCITTKRGRRAATKQSQSSHCGTPIWVPNTPPSSGHGIKRPKWRVWGFPCQSTQWGCKALTNILLASFHEPQPSVTKKKKNKKLFFPQKLLFTCC